MSLGFCWVICTPSILFYQLRNRAGARRAALGASARRFAGTERGHPTTRSVPMEQAQHGAAVGGPGGTGTLFLGAYTPMVVVALWSVE